MITDRGAAAELEPIDPSWLADAEWVHLPLYGFAAPASRAALLDAARTLAERGVPVSLDLSSVATMRELGADILAAVIADVRPAVVFANADEAALAVELGVRPCRDRGVRRSSAAAIRSSCTSTASRDEVPVERVPRCPGLDGRRRRVRGRLHRRRPRRRVTAHESARAGSVLAMSALRRAGAL